MLQRSGVQIKDESDFQELFARYDTVGDGLITEDQFAQRYRLGLYSVVFVCTQVYMMREYTQQCCSALVITASLYSHSTDRESFYKFLQIRADQNEKCGSLPVTVLFFIVYVVCMCVPLVSTSMTVMHARTCLYVFVHPCTATLC